MISHDLNSICLITDRRRLEDLRNAEIRRLARSAAREPRRRAGDGIGAELAGLVARLRPRRHGQPVATLGERLPSV